MTANNRQPERANPIAPGSLVLREVIESDLPELFDFQSDPEANRMAGFPAREWPPFLSHRRTIMRNPTGVLRTILVGGQVAGDIGSYVLEGECEVWYWIGRAFWGRGVATIALQEFLRMETRRPLHARTVIDNVASQRVLHKCGFDPEGVPSTGQDDPEAEAEALFVLRA